MYKKLYLASLLASVFLMNGCGADFSKSTETPSVNNSGSVNDPEKEPVKQLPTTVENDILNLKLKGENPLIIQSGTEYNEDGATATDDGKDVSSKIKISGDVKKDQVGKYLVHYEVSDKNGKKVELDRTVLVVALYDNMEKEGNHGWVGDSNLDKVTVVTDDERESKVLSLKGSFRGGIKSDNSLISWRMKAKKRFRFQLLVTTKNGERYISYEPKDSGMGVNVSTGGGHYIIHGIGSSSTNEEWHAFTRDIAADIKRYEPENSFEKINALLVSGEVKLDDIILSSDPSSFNIQKSAIISEPGIVLTFDDSLVDDWYKAKGLFNEHGAVATWFCHRWAPYEGNPIDENEAVKLKELASDDDEIGIHTVDHLSTKDERYNKYDTVEEKAQAYFSGQVKPAIDDMLKRGFEKPESFSYPYISGQPAHNKVIRKELPHIREFFGQVVEIDELPPTDERSITFEEIKTFLDKLKKENEIGVFVGHRILPKANFKPDQGLRVSTERLKRVMEYAQKIGLKFYTLKEAHNIYLNQ